MTGDHLFDPDEFRAPSKPSRDAPLTPLPEGSRVVRVLPDVSGLDKTFDYYCPQKWVDRLAIGSIVRVELHGRRVSGWVVELDSEPPEGVSLRPVDRVTSYGPPEDVIELARWISYRWDGPLRSVLKSASSPRVVRSLPARRPTSTPNKSTDDLDEVAVRSVEQPGVTAVQASPITDPVTFVIAAQRRGSVLVVAADGEVADSIVVGLRRHGVRAARYPGQWMAGLTGSVVVGQRSAVLAPMSSGPDTIIVLDDHVESLQEERVPTWHAADVAVERSQRAGGRCLLLGPMASLSSSVRADRVISVPRAQERAGWPVVEVIDRRQEDPKLSTTLFPPLLVERLRAAGASLLILNRKGRARMLACAACLELVRSEDGQRLMIERDGRLESSTGESRPLVCAHCGSTRLKRLRPGVSRIVEEASALVDGGVRELSTDVGVDPSLNEVGARVVVGTEAALHRIRHRLDLVAFLDFDQELFAPRFRAGEQAMALLVRAARLLGGRQPGGRLIISTRIGEHPVLAAARSADMRAFADTELESRRALMLPPHGAMAEVSGAGAELLAAELNGVPEVSVVGPRADGHYLVSATNHDVLADALRATRPRSGRVRVAVDPPRA